MKTGVRGPQRRGRTVCVIKGIAFAVLSLSLPRL